MRALLNTTNNQKHFSEVITIDSIKNEGREKASNLLDPSSKVADLLELFTNSEIPSSKKANSIGDNIPQITKKYVHKENDANVLISTPEKIDNIWYFNMLKGTNEFRFDHESDHMQGMLIMEVARQSSIATTHLEGLNLDGVITLKKFQINFVDFLDPKELVLIRTFSRPVVTRKGKFYQSVLVNFIQNDKVLSTAIVEGMSFDSREVVENYLKIFNKRK